LWSVIESKRQIFDIDQLYHGVIIYVKDVSQNIPSFMRGEMSISFSDHHDMQSPIHTSLIAPFEHDEIVEDILNMMLPAMERVLRHIFGEYLPGGKWQDTDPETKKKADGITVYNGHKLIGSACSCNASFQDSLRTTNSVKVSLVMSTTSSDKNPTSLLSRLNL
jgi:hypothetical protein